MDDPPTLDSEPKGKGREAHTFQRQRFIPHPLRSTQALWELQDMRNSFPGVNQSRDTQLTGSGRVPAEGGGAPSGDPLTPLSQGCTLLFPNQNTRPVPDVKDARQGLQCHKRRGEKPKFQNRRENKEARTPAPSSEGGRIVPELFPYT